jgi:hypothetical protein
MEEYFAKCSVTGAHMSVPVANMSVTDSKGTASDALALQRGLEKLDGGTTSVPSCRFRGRDGGRPSIRDRDDQVTELFRGSVQSVNFDQGDARGVVLADDNGRVKGRRQRSHDSRLGVVRRREASRLNLGLLGVFPVVVECD